LTLSDSKEFTESIRQTATIIALLLCFLLRPARQDGKLLAAKSDIHHAE
jgi:hypothetical protein